MFVTDYLLPVLTGVGSFAFAIVILSRFLYAKVSYRPVYIGLAAIAASVLMALVNTLWISYLNMLSVYVIFIIITHVFFKGNAALKIGFSVTIMTINGLSEHLIVFFMFILSQQRTAEINASPLYYNLIGISTLIVFILLARLIIKLYPRKYRSLNWREVFLISYQVLAGGASIIIMDFTEAIDISFAANLFMVLFHTALLTFSLLIFFVFDSALRKQETENQNAFYRYQFEQIKSSQAVIGKMQHDMEKHLLALKLDLSNAHPHEAERKIDALIGGIHSEKSIANSGDLDIDAILNYKGAQASESGVSIVCDLRLPYTLNMDTTDLSVILCNAIDNAVEACKPLPPDERVINVAISYEKQNLRMTISNPYTGELNLSPDGDILTTKARGLHGIGLDSIRDAVEKYDGLMDIRTQDGQFTLNIILFNLPGQ